VRLYRRQFRNVGDAVKPFSGLDRGLNAGSRASRASVLTIAISPVSDDVVMK
jgi:hypothetical protein